MKKIDKRALFNIAKDVGKAGFDVVRGVGEVVASPASMVIAGRATPSGNGKSVIMVPGFGANEFSLKPMAFFLRKKGYQTFDWDMGQNLFLNEARMAQLERHVEAVYKERGDKVTLIGQSLGGLIAMVLAARRPDLVEGIITLGSPLGYGDNPDDVSLLTKAAFEGLNTYIQNNQADIQGMTEETSPLETLLSDPDRLQNVNITAIYSKGDGIVGGKISKVPLENSDNNRHQNIEIGRLTDKIGVAAHCGMGFNVQVLTIIGEVLSKSKGQSPHFDTKKYPRIFPRQIIKRLPKIGHIFS